MIHPLIGKINLDFLHYRLAGDEVVDYIWFGTLVAAAFLLLRPLTAGTARIGSAIAKRFSETEHGAMFREMITGPLRRLVQCILLFIAVNRLDAPFNTVLIRRDLSKNKVNLRIIDVLDHLFLFFFILFITLLISRIVDFIFRLRLEKARREGQAEKMQILPLLREVVKLLVWATCFFTMMGTVFHVNVPALITGLGIGGVAIALAGKETVENLFASFTILADKPFRMGDVVRVGNFEGAAEKIGFRSTQLRSADGSLYVIPNKKLIDDNLENLTRRAVRRVRVPLMVKYGMSGEDLRVMTGELETVLKEMPEVRKPTEVAVEHFGENVVQLMVTYYVKHPLPSGELARIKQEVALRIFAVTSRYAPKAPAPAPGPQTGKPEQDHASSKHAPDPGESQEGSGPERGNP